MTTIASGPPGVEVTHQWNSGIILNNRAAVPRYRVKSIAGFHSLAEAEDNRESRGNRYGEVVLPSRSRGKTIVYTGYIGANTLDGLAVAVTALRGAFRDRSNEGIMRLGGAVPWDFLARVMQFDADSDFTFYVPNRVMPWRMPFTLGLRMTTGRFLAIVGTVQASGILTGVSSTLTNLGNSDAEPAFTVTGVPANGTVTLVNESIPGGGKTLQFTGLPSGTLTIDFHARSAFVGGVDVSGKLNVLGSNWWDAGVPGVIPGANVLKVTGGTWTVEFYHTSE